mmetsp:Transcript_23947/g.42431  ORF Transcript_23947/g.42431 Transcript_23947/m.42431 type:complete len:201 (+) Transcript_23947:779-1381(+)
MTATECLAPLMSLVSSGVKDRLYGGSFRSLRPSLSCLTQAGLHWRISSWKLVASHTSLSFGTSPWNTVLPSRVTETLVSSRTRPIDSQRTPEALHSSRTESTFASATSTTRPTSSLNKKSIPPRLDKASLLKLLVAEDTVTSNPVLPEKAISRRVVSRPPSLRSWPAAMSPLPMSDCIVTNIALNALASSTSGATAPSCL